MCEDLHVHKADRWRAATKASADQNHLSCPRAQHAWLHMAQASPHVSALPATNPAAKPPRPPTLSKVRSQSHMLGRAIALLYFSASAHLDCVYVSERDTGVIQKTVMPVPDVRTTSQTHALYVQGGCCVAQVMPTPALHGPLHK